MKKKKNVWMNDEYYIQQLEKKIEEQEQFIENYKSRIELLDNQLEQAKYAYSVISNAASWKITAPVRAFLDMIKKVPFMLNAINSVKHVKNHVFSYIRDDSEEKSNPWIKYAELGDLLLYSFENLKKQQEKVYRKNIKFSILVPLYNTPEKFLRDMIQSVKDQTYQNWELCLADGSDHEHSQVKRICRQYAWRDKRIKYRKLKKNYGIAGNTNACLAMASGDYFGLLDHDDILHPVALYEMMNAICEYNADFLYTDEATFISPDLGRIIVRHYKPDFAPDNLCANNYICHFSVFSAALQKKVGKFHTKYDGAQDYDMILRLTEKAKMIVHIPKILYFWRGHDESTSLNSDDKNYAIKAGRMAIKAHLKRIGLKGKVVDLPVRFIYRIKYELQDQRKVSIIIPNYEHQRDLEKCLNSIFSKTTYSNFEVIIIENNSHSEDILIYYQQIQDKWNNVKVIKWKGEWNYSAINNYGVSFVSGDYLLLLNNDTEVITNDWIQEMMMYAQRPDVGAVGAKLYYPDKTVQHGGVILGMGGIAGHVHRGVPLDDNGYMGRLIYAQNFSAVTAACLLLRRSIWDEVGGLDEEFTVSFNDVDLCMRIRKAGYLIVWTPFAKLYHSEFKSRGLDDTYEKQVRGGNEIKHFKELWSKELEEGDPYFNPNLNLEREDYSWD